MKCKRILALVLTLTIIFALAGCGGKKSSDTPSVETASLGELTWPDHRLATLIPRPESTIGEIYWEHEDNINIRIGKVTLDDYSAYVEECKVCGFSNVTSEGNTFFHSRNKDGYRIDLSYHEDDSTMNIIISDPLYEVQIEVNCLSNLMFSRYDIDVYVGLNKLGSIEHGGEATYQVELEKGIHTLRIQNQEDDSVDGEYEFELPGTSTIRCNVSCSSDQVEIKVIENVTLPFSSSDLIGKPYEDVKDMIHDANLWDIHLNNISDLTADNIAEAGLVSSVTIDGNSEFSTGDTVRPEAAITIEYHTAAELSPPYNDDTVNGMDYSTVADAFTSAGFTNVSIVEEVVSSARGAEDGAIASVQIDGKYIHLDKVYPADSEVVIKYYTVDRSPVSYSTNDYETAKLGNSGVFSYVNRGPSYDIYWIIDFDEGYVYYFTDGNGDEGCDKVKMESGDLNDVLIVTYHDGGDTWSYGLHFHYKNQPTKLIMQDNDGFEYEYTTTNLAEALELRAGKTIHEY